jgi:hypothetical protein
MSALDTQQGGSHYKSLTIQPVEYITKNSIPYLEGNVIKYVTRHAAKNGIEDIKKAIHYLQLIAELQYGTILAESETETRITTLSNQKGLMK